MRKRKTQTPKQFRHKPLPDSTTHFRLLEVLNILHDQPDRRVVCKLTIWPIEEAPTYHAVSYTWGDPNATAHITLDGADLVVRANCEYVLRQAFASGASKYLWVDAICIDQETTQEKNHQVAMMGQVYKKAAHVFACVGPQEDDSEFLFKTIAKNHALLLEIYSQASVADNTKSGDWAVSNPIPRRRSLALRCFFMLRAATRKRLGAAYLAFMKRPYFSRVWVLQELYLATDISCLCGMETRPFHHILAISLLVDFWVNEEIHASSWRSGTQQFVSLISQMPWILRRQRICKTMGPGILSIQPQLGCLALATGAWGPRRLADVLDAMQHFHCADVRNKLYGILRLVDWNGNPAPIPEYHKDCFEVAVEVHRRVLREIAREPSWTTIVEWTGRLCEVFNMSADVGNLLCFASCQLEKPSLLSLPTTSYGNEDIE